MVRMKQTTKLHKAMVQMINDRIEAKSLDYVLVSYLTVGMGLEFANATQEMLASYKDVKTRPCDKCSRLLDRNAQFPVVRTRKRAQQPDGLYTKEWLALHQPCA